MNSAVTTWLGEAKKNAGMIQVFGVVDGALYRGLDPRSLSLSKNDRKRRNHGNTKKCVAMPFSSVSRPGCRVRRR
jgi:hypothetical protein